MDTSVLGTFIAIGLETERRFPAKVVSHAEVQVNKDGEHKDSGDDDPIEVIAKLVLRGR